MTNLDSILRSRDITLPTKVHLVKAMVFSVVMYGCESWSVKKAEWRRIDAFEVWCWRRLLRVPWTARRSNQSILKETSLGCSLEGLMLKLQYFGHLMQRVDSLENTLMLGGIGGKRRWQRQGWHSWMASVTQCTWVWVNSGSWLWTGRPGVLRFMGSKRVGHDRVTELNWMALVLRVEDEKRQFLLSEDMHFSWGDISTCQSSRLCAWSREHSPEFGRKETGVKEAKTALPITDSSEPKNRSLEEGLLLSHLLCLSTTSGWYQKHKSHCFSSLTQVLLKSLLLDQPQSNPHCVTSFKDSFLLLVLEILNVSHFSLCLSVCLQPLSPPGWGLRS